MSERERCPAPDADGRWCEFVGNNGGPYRCIRCGAEHGTSGSGHRDETSETGSDPDLLQALSDSIDQARAARARRSEPTGMRCEIKAGDGKDSRCTRTDTVYRRGKWVCPTHGPEPESEPQCSHSAVMWGRCSYCGTTITNQQGEANG